MGLIAQAAPSAPPSAAPPPGTPPAGLPGKPSAGAPVNPVLAKARQDIEAKLPPALKTGYQQILVAGMALLFSQQTHPYMRQVLQKIQQGGNNPTLLANAMINLLGILQKQSQGKMQIEAAFPAAVALLTQVLEYMERTQGFKTTPEFLKAVGVQMKQKFLAKFGGGGGNAPAQPPTQPTAPASPMPPTASTGGM